MWDIQWNNPRKALGGVPGHSRGSRVLYKADLYPGEILKSDTFCNPSTHMLWVDNLNSTHSVWSLSLPNSYPHYCTQVSSLYVTEWGPRELKKNRNMYPYLQGDYNFWESSDIASKTLMTQGTLRPSHKRPASLSEWMEDSMAREG